MNSSHHQASSRTIYTRPITSSLPENSSTLLLQIKILFTDYFRGLLDPEDESNMTLRNVENYFSSDTVSHPRRRKFLLQTVFVFNIITFTTRCHVSWKKHTICSCRFKIRIACKLKTNVSLNFVNFLELYTEDAMRLRVSIKQCSLMSWPDSHITHRLLLFVSVPMRRGWHRLQDGRCLCLTDVATGGVLSTQREGDGTADSAARDIEVNIWTSKQMQRRREIPRVKGRKIKRCTYISIYSINH